MQVQPGKADVDTQLGRQHFGRHVRFANQWLEQLSSTQQGTIHGIPWTRESDYIIKPGDGILTFGNEERFQRWVWQPHYQAMSRGPRFGPAVETIGKHLSEIPGIIVVLKGVFRN